MQTSTKYRHLKLFTKFGKIFSLTLNNNPFKKIIIEKCAAAFKTLYAEKNKLHLAIYNQPLGSFKKVNLKTRTKTYKMPKSIDFYLAHVWKGK
jgi:hypothetical protein